MRLKCTTDCYRLVKLDDRKRKEGLADMEFEMLISSETVEKWKENPREEQKESLERFCGIENEKKNVKEEQKELRMSLSDFLKKRGLKKKSKQTSIGVRIIVMWTLNKK